MSNSKNNDLAPEDTGSKDEIGKGTTEGDQETTPDIKVGVVDDHALVRKGLAALLDDTPGIEVVLEAEHGEHLLQELKHVQPDIILLDLDMPVMPGQKVLPILKEKHPDLKVIILSMHDEDSMILLTMELGANAYLTKGGDPDELEKAVRMVYESDYYLSPRVSLLTLQRLQSPKSFKTSSLTSEALSRREMEVLQLVCKEFSNADIAERLHISPRTVEGHRQRIIQKIGAKNTIGMVVFAIKEGLVEV